jgi:predicted O-linked N-acetylglucosamine transferase (SPINDLY family)
VTLPPVEKNGFVTFGSFNNFSKVTPQVLAAWAEVLRGVSDSRMLILAKVNPPLKAYVKDSFQKLGIDPDRVELCSFRPTREYLELRGLVDITLDTFPFNGHTTTCDTLWQGVPVVALAGDTYCSRFGSSALVNLRLESLIATSTQQYIQIATELAHDRPRLAQMRAKLRDTMRSSIITDAKRFTRNLEAAYRQMWADWCSGPTRA